MTRIGKIARLPAELRDELNRRLNDGQPAKSLLRWLNGLAAVRAVLQADFAGQPISPQNLSEWRKGGYRDWLWQQEATALVQTLTTQADAARAPAGDSLTESLAVWLTAQYALAARDLTDQGDWRRLRELCEDLVALRKGDHSAARLKLERERWAAEQASEQRRQEEARRMAPLGGLIKRKSLLSALGLAPLNSPVGLATSPAPASADESEGEP